VVFLIIKCITLVGMWYLCYDGGCWLFYEMWKGDDYGVLDLEFMYKFLFDSDVSKINFLFIVFTYGPIYYLMHLMIGMNIIMKFFVFMGGALLLYNIYR